MTKKKLTTKEIIVKNIKKLKIDTKYSYASFCRELGFTKGSSKTMKEHIELILELIEYEQVGKQYIVKGFKDVSDEKIIEMSKDKRGTSENSRGNNKSEYSDPLINSFLFKILDGAFQEDSQTLQDDGDTIILISSRNDIAESMGIRNKNNYAAYKSSPNFFCQFNEIDNRVADFLFPSFSTKSFNVANSVLNSISRNSLAVISPVMEVLVPLLEDEEGRVLDKNDEDDLKIIKENIKKKKFKRVLTDEETRKSIELERNKLIKRMNFGDKDNKRFYKNISQLYNFGSKEDKEKFNKRLNKITSKKFGVYKNIPKIEVRTSLSLIQNHLLKFEQLKLEEFMDKGYEAYHKAMMEKVEENKNLDVNLELQEKLFEYRRKRGMEVALRYDLIQKEDNYIELANKFLYIMTNNNAPHTPIRERDIKREGEKNHSYLIIRPQGCEIEEVEEIYIEDDEQAEEMLDKLM